MDRVNITFLSREGNVKMEMTSANVPRTGDMVELLTGPADSRREFWVVTQCAWDYWPKNITIMIERHTR